MLIGLASDLQYVIRVLGKSRGFTAIAVLSLAIGIGANTAIFSVIRHLLLDPLPVSKPRELALVYWSEPAAISISQINSGLFKDPATGASYRSNYSYELYQALKATAGGRSIDVSGFNYMRDMSVVVDGQPAIHADGLLADGAFFRTLQPGTALGRPLTDADDAPGAPPVAVLGYAFWQRAFGGDPTAVGRTVRVNGITFEVVGVTPRNFRGFSRGGFFPQTDVTVPLATQPLIAGRWSPAGGALAAVSNVYWIRLVARIPVEARDDVARAMTPVLRSLLPAEALSGAQPPAVRLLPGGHGDQSVTPETARLLIILAGVVGVVLLITCVNLAALMLARGMGRQRELAVRRALGATRLRLTRQLLVEGLVLAAMGACGGLLVAVWSRRLLTTLLSVGVGASGFDRTVMSIDTDARMLALTIGVGLVAALLFSLLPALRLARIDPGAHLKHQTAGSGAPKLTLGRALIAAQIAVSVPLVVGAALFLRTVLNLSAIDVGFEPAGLASFRVNPANTSVREAEQPRLYMDLLRGIGAIPGVASATLVENALMSGLTSSNKITIDGREATILMNAVGPGFFETVGMRLIAGRAPGALDTAAAPHVAVVNQMAVRELFGGISPVGRRVRVGSRTVDIVGIVNDSRYARQRAAVRPILFDAALQRGGFGGHNILIRTTTPAASLEPAIRAAVAAVDPDLPVPEVQTQFAHMARTSARERVFTQLLTIVGGFVLLLSAIGLHGVTSYTVARRTMEIGVRIALGAQQSQVLWLILSQVVVLAAIGLAIGIPLALAAAPLVGTVLYGVAPNDAATVACASALMLVVAVGAGLVPARKAARMEPLAALRAES